jgi:uncharacterized phage-associated protein
MNNLTYIKYDSVQLEKIGHTVIYLSQKITSLSKTKLLKLLYILDEISIKKSGLPFVNLKYKVWKFGPVSEEIFIDLSSETTLLSKYIKNTNNEGVGEICPKIAFSDDEFSDNDIDLMNFVIEKYGNASAKELVSYTHRVNSPWHTTAKENSVLHLLEKEEINNTELLIDMSTLIAHDPRKMEIYSEYLELH